MLLQCGALRPSRARSLLGALFWSLCCEPQSTGHLPSVTSHRFSPCKLLNCPGTTTSPHLDSTLACDVTHHREEPLGAVGCAARVIKSSCISLSFHTLLCLSIHSSCLSWHHTSSYNTSLCACCANNQKLGGSPTRVHRKQQQAHIISLLCSLRTHLRCFG